jgi:hypothetical protein
MMGGERPRRADQRLVPQHRSAKFNGLPRRVGSLRFADGVTHTSIRRRTYGHDASRVPDWQGLTRKGGSAGPCFRVIGIQSARRWSRDCLLLRDHTQLDSWGSIAGLRSGTCRRLT